jgi:hypothetical protein
MAKTTSAAVKKAAARTTAKPKKKRTIYQALAADRRARERGETASRMTPAERRELLRECQRIISDSAPTMETADSAALVASADEVATVKATANDVDAAYRRMVAAVRELLALEHPRLSPDRIDIAAYSDDGGGESLAGFHADAEDPYVAGDMRAIEPTA